MKRKLTIRGTLSAVISTGSFENLRPGFAFEETYEDCDFTDEQMVKRSEELYDKADSMMFNAENKAVIKRIERERSDMRFAVSPETGETYPSTTSVIGWDADFFVNPEELRQYASQSNITHEIVNLFIETDEWVNIPETDIFNKLPKELNNIWTDIVICTKGDLKLPLKCGDFKGFLAKYPIDDMNVGIQAFNEKAKTHGTNDFTGIPKGWKDAEEIETCFDVKRTPQKIKDGMQLADYCFQRGLKQGIIVPLNNKTEQKFSKPVIYNEKALSGFYQMFLGKRKDFKKRYAL